MPEYFSRLLRPNIRELRPYSSARDEFSGEATVFLDANENAYGSVGGGEFSRYGDPYQRTLKEKIAQLRGVAVEQILIGNGSDEVLDLLGRAFCEPRKDNVLVLPPTFSIYQVQAEINDIAVREVPLDSQFQPNVEAIQEAIDERSKLLFLCSPNNPTGNCIERRRIEALLRSFPGIVVVDEAYVDFAPGESVIPLLSRYENLAVAQTFSKGWGLAGIRIGVLYGAPALIDALNLIKPPYNTSIASEQIASRALDCVEQRDQYVADLIAGRRRLAEAFTQIEGIQQVYPSDANFLFLRVGDADAIYRKLLTKGIVVRNLSKKTGCANCLRITVGTEEENELLLSALQECES